MEQSHTRLPLRCANLGYQTESTGTTKGPRRSCIGDSRFGCRTHLFSLKNSEDSAEDSRFGFQNRTRYNTILPELWGSTIIPRFERRFFLHHTWRIPGNPTVTSNHQTSLPPRFPRSPPISAFQTTFSSYAKPTSLSLYSCNLAAAISVQAPASSLLPFLPSKSLRFQFVSSISLIFSLFFIGFGHQNPTFHSISGFEFWFFTTVVSS